MGGQPGKALMEGSGGAFAASLTAGPARPRRAASWRHLEGGYFERSAAEFTWRGIKLNLPIPQRGYRFEPTPPVEVEVLPGTVRGKIQRAPVRVVRIPRPRPQPHAGDAATAVAPPLPPEKPSEPPSARASKESG